MAGDRESDRAIAKTLLDVLKLLYNAVRSIPQWDQDRFVKLDRLAATTIANAEKEL